MLVDTHCHLDFERFDADRDDVVDRALAAGITRIIVPALHPSNWAAVLSLTERFPCVFAALGVHPNSAADWTDDWLDRLAEWAVHEKVVAIGEIGLDFYWDRSPRLVQERAFTAQLALAHALHLPVIVHNREADAAVLAALAASPMAGTLEPGVLHSFSSDESVAEAALEMGFYIGLTGPLTYPAAETLRQVARAAPADRLLVETDAPFLPPQGHRGRRNEPAYVALVNDRLAAVREQEPAAMARQTTANARRLFARLSGAGANGAPNG